MMIPTTENAKSILIEALFTPNCKSRKATLSMIETIRRNRSLNVDLREITIRSTREAHVHRFLGSPSIHVNGQDIEPQSREKSDYGVG